MATNKTTGEGNEGGRKTRKKGESDLKKQAARLVAETTETDSATHLRRLRSIKKAEVREAKAHADAREAKKTHEAQRRLWQRQFERPPSRRSLEQLEASLKSRREPLLRRMQEGPPLTPTEARDLESFNNGLDWVNERLRAKPVQRRRGLATKGKLEAPAPNIDNAPKTGKTGAKDEGLVQKPEKQEPAKNAERLQTDSARAETTQRLIKALRPHELTEFLAHAAAHPWDGNSGVRPSDHIKTQFAKWIALGLSRTDIVAAQPNLAQAYATETSRYPERRVKGLVVRPHKLPPGAKPAISMRPVWQLTKKELEAKRALERAKKQRQRQRQKDATLT
jgi:hypothetical protein